MSHLYLELLGDMGLLLAAPVIALIIITLNRRKRKMHGSHLAVTRKSPSTLASPGRRTRSDRFVASAGGTTIGWPPNSKKLPTPEKPRIVFHVRCFGTEITGLIYTETNRYTGKQQWIFRVDMDGVNSAAKCEWQTEREAVANAEEFQKNHLRFQLETMCDDARQQIGLEPLNQENRPMSEHAQ